MSEKLNIAVFCGGQSTEHDVSIQSARNVVAALDKFKYHVSVIYIDHAGAWYLIENPQTFLEIEPSTFIQHAHPIAVTFANANYPFFFLRESQKQHPVDCVFPMIHGTYGEDGSLQGLLDLLNLPYVGADTQSSAICMEKDLTKALLRFHHIPVLDWHTVYPDDNLQGLYKSLSASLDKALFVKAASLGSSVGTMPVKDETEFLKALKEIFKYDDRAIVEPRVHGREIECAVLGNRSPKASLPSEIILHHDYYSYAAKYLDAKGATTEVPAKLSPEITEKIQTMAVNAFKAVNCSGMARVDFFVLSEKEVFINELNTIPGFTSISMYPKMWEASGLAYSSLLDELIRLALERYQHQQKLIRHYVPG